MGRRGGGPLRARRASSVGLTWCRRPAKRAGTGSGLAPCPAGLAAAGFAGRGAGEIGAAALIAYATVMSRTGMSVLAQGADSDRRDMTFVDRRCDGTKRALGSVGGGKGGQAALVVGGGGWCGRRRRGGTGNERNA
jgi:hypothetical protein